MKAVVYDRYGPPEVQRLEEVERPVPKADEILVRVHATTVNRTDCGWRSAKPFFVRYFIGLRGPKQKILGMELAGEVEAVGTAVTDFEVGAEIVVHKGPMDDADPLAFEAWALSDLLVNQVSPPK